MSVTRRVSKPHLLVRLRTPFDSQIPGSHRNPHCFAGRKLKTAYVLTRKTCFKVCSYTAVVDVYLQTSNLQRGRRRHRHRLRLALFRRLLPGLAGRNGKQVDGPGAQNACLHGQRLHGGQPTSLLVNTYYIYNPRGKRREEEKACPARLTAVESSKPALLPPFVAPETPADQKPLRF